MTPWFFHCLNERQQKKKYNEMDEPLSIRFLILSICELLAHTHTSFQTMTGIDCVRCAWTRVPRVLQIALERAYSAIMPRSK